MRNLCLMTLVCALSLFALACGGEEPPNNQGKPAPYTGPLPVGAVDEARNTEAVMGVSTLRQRLQLAATRWQGGVDALGRYMEGTVTEEKLEKINATGALNSNTYKTGNYVVSYLGSGTFEVTASRENVQPYTERFTIR